MTKFGIFIVIFATSIFGYSVIDFNTCNSSVYLSSSELSNFVTDGYTSNDDIRLKAQDFCDSRIEQATVLDVRHIDTLHVGVTLRNERFGGFEHENILTLPSVHDLKHSILSDLTLNYTEDDEKDSKHITELLDSYYSNHKMTEVVALVRVSSALKTVTIVTDVDTYTFGLTDNIQ